MNSDKSTNDIGFVINTLITRLKNVLISDPEVMDCDEFPALNASVNKVTKIFNNVVLLQSHKQAINDNRKEIAALVFFPLLEAFSYLTRVINKHPEFFKSFFDKEFSCKDFYNTGYFLFFGCAGIFSNVFEIMDELQPGLIPQSIPNKCFSQHHEDNTDTPFDLYYKLKELSYEEYSAFIKKLVSDNESQFQLLDSLIKNDINTFDKIIRLTSKSPWNYPVSIDDILALSWLTFDINMLLLHYEQTNIL